MTLSLGEKRTNAAPSSWLASLVYFGMKSGAYEFLENLSYFLSAGMSVLDSLKDLEEESSSWRMRKVISRIREDVECGMALSTSFKRQNFFEQNVVEIIASGEVSGKLVENLRLIIIINDENRRLRSKINSSLLYGAIIIVLTFVVGVGTAWFVLPGVAAIYKDIGAELPWATKLLVSIGNFVVNYGKIVIPLFIITVLIIFYFLFSFPKTKFVGHLILFHLPLVKNLIKESEITRFGHLMGKIVEAGLPINKALEILPGTTTFRNYSKLYVHLGVFVSQGISISKALKNYGKVKKLIPGNVVQMISSAEKSGKLGETFLRISSLYGAKLESTSRNLPIIIEPLLLLLVGIGVALFSLATILPIYNLADIIE